MYITKVKGKCVGSYGTYFGEEESFNSIYDYSYGLKFMEDESPCNYGDFHEYIYLIELKEVFESSTSRFEYDDKEDNLYIIVEYKSKELPTPQQAIDITDYTQGQWSDGIGESYEQFPICIQDDYNDLEFYISMWYQSQKPETTIHKEDE